MRRESVVHFEPIRVCVLALGMILPVGMTAADAQAPVDARVQLQVFMQSPLHDQLVGDALKRFAPAVFQPCPGLVSKGSTVQLFEPISVGADGLPNAGAWRQSFPVSGCGAPITLNIFFVASSQRIRAVIAAPGDTLADPRLQADAFKYAVISAQHSAGSCRAFDVVGTHFDGYEKADAAPTGKLRAPWNETWTLAGCGAAYDVPMKFIPQGVGTVIAAAPSVTHP